MTSKLKCPFCQQELGVILCDPDDFICPKCRLCGTESLWQALIRVKQDLKIATKALKLYCGKDVWYCWDSKIDTTQAEEALAQIEHKVKDNDFCKSRQRNNQ